MKDKHMVGNLHSVSKQEKSSSQLGTLLSPWLPMKSLRKVHVCKEPVRYDNGVIAFLSCLQVPAKKSEQEIQDEEEEELQLAMALSLSQEEAAKDVC